MSHRIDRRTAVGGLLAGGLLGSMVERVAGAADPVAPATTVKGRSFGLGFSLYGTKKLPLDQALKLCAETGFDCVELPVMVDWPWDSAKLDAAARDKIRATLTTHRMRLGAIMENLSLAAPDEVHRKNVERLKLAGELAYSLSPARPPVVETILGGRPADWEKVKQEFVARLGDWEKTAAAARVVLAVKPHVAGALHQPEDAAWLVKQINSPWLRAAFDYSHFQLRGRTLAECLSAMLDVTAFIHVKDGRGTPDKFQFLLPGEGTTDYRDYFSRLATANYRGDVIVEVSGQLHTRPDYDPVSAVQKSFAALK